MADGAVTSLKSKVSEAEWKARVDLAALYRLVALHGWDDMIFTHISARVPGPEHHFLINPYGWYFDEITASCLVKVDLDGRVIDPPGAEVIPVDVDEGGYFYCANSGRIVNGIKHFKITPSADVILQENAKTGRYRWYPLKPGTYTLQFILPKGLHTVTELEKGQLYVTPANGALVNLAWSEDISREGQLARFNPQDLPAWYSSFVIQEGAAPIINHNIPLRGGVCDTPES